jgi:outer membrane protein assembly factor BamB
VVERADSTSSRRLARRARASALLALLCTGLATAATGQELAFPGGVIWQLRFDAPPAQLPAFDTHSAYLVMRDGHVRAIDHATGNERWSAPASSSVRPASSGRSVAGADGASAWSLDAGSGRAAWQRDLGSAAAAAPVVTAPGPVFLTTGGDLVLLAWADGREIWRAPMPAPVSAPLAAGADRVWVGLEDGRVLALGLSDGQVRWTTMLGARVLGMTAIDDRLFVGAADNLFRVLKANDGEIAWRWRTGGDVAGRAVADARRVYYTSLDAMLRAHDRRRGDMRWQRPLTSRAVGGPLLSGSRLIVAGVSPELRAFRTSDGGQEGFAPVPGRPLHEPFLAPATASAPVRMVLLTAGGHFLAIGQTVEPMLVPMDSIPGRRLPPEVLPDIIKRSGRPRPSGAAAPAASGPVEPR